MDGIEASSARLKRVIAVWAGLPTIDDVPRRDAFSPALLDPRDLPYIVLLDVLDGGEDFRFRLAGTEVVHAVGFEFTGVRLSEKRDELDVPELIDSYRTCVASRRPLVYSGTLARFDKQFVAYERVTLPLADSDGTVSRLLGALDFGSYENP